MIAVLLEPVELLVTPATEILTSWIDELRPGTRRILTSINTRAPFTPEQKRQAVADLCDRQDAAREDSRYQALIKSVLDRFIEDERRNFMRNALLQKEAEEGHDNNNGSEKPSGKQYA